MVIPYAFWSGTFEATQCTMETHSQTRGNTASYMVQVYRKLFSGLAVATRGRGGVLIGVPVNLTLGRVT